MKVIKKIPLPNGKFRTQVSTDFSNTISMTDQSFQKECDVNEIIKNYTRTGQLPSRGPGFYDEDGIHNIDGLLGAYDSVRQAEEAFSSLPSELRTKLKNDPRQLISYLSNPENHNEAYEFGLLKNPPKPKNTYAPPTAQTKQSKKTKMKDDSNDDLNDET